MDAPTAALIMAVLNFIIILVGQFLSHIRAMRQLEKTKGVTGEVLRTQDRVEEVKQEVSVVHQLANSHQSTLDKRIAELEAKLLTHGVVLPPTSPPSPTVP